MTESVCYGGYADILCTARDWTVNGTFADLDATGTVSFMHPSIGNQMCYGTNFDTCSTESARSDTTSTVYYGEFQTSWKPCSFGHRYRAFGSWDQRYDPIQHVSAVFTDKMAETC